MKITEIGKTTTYEPPFTFVIQASGLEWVHHVDAEGKAAGGVYNGIPYEGSANNIHVTSTTDSIE